MRRIILFLTLACLLGSAQSLAQTSASAVTHVVSPKKKVGRALTAEEIQAKGDDLTRKATELSKEAQRDEAIRLLDEACDLYQRAAGMFYQNRQKGKEVGALDGLAKALRQKIFNLYELSFDDDSYKSTCENQTNIYRRSFAAFPIFIQKLNYGLASLAITHEAYDKALPLLESVRTKGSQNPESESLKTKSMGEMALCHLHLGHDDKARRIIREAIQRAPSDQRLRQIQREIAQKVNLQ
ncbi:MAG: hypothetical protein J5637_00120 [Prevotella sp.]|nr:hypothetical protein [Prevotella sp.]